MTDYNYISVSKGSQRNARVASTKSNFFKLNEDIIININEGKLVITRPTIDYRGKTVKVCDNHSGWVQFCISGDGLPTGRFEFDKEESDEDKLVIYLENNVE